MRLEFQLDLDAEGWQEELRVSPEPFVRAWRGFKWWVETATPADFREKHGRLTGEFAIPVPDQFGKQFIFNLKVEGETLYIQHIRIGEWKPMGDSKERPPFR